MSVIQSTTGSVLLQNQNSLDYKINKIRNQVCLIEGLLKDIEDGEITNEQDPIFLASPSHRITTQQVNILNNFTSEGYPYIAVELPTFAALQAYSFSTTQPIRFDIINDEVKNQTYTVYYWNGNKLWWSAEILDTFQPTTII